MKVYTYRYLVFILLFSSFWVWATPLLAAPGDLKWEFSVDGYKFSAPGIDSNGIIYVSGQKDREPISIFALNPDGTTKWQMETDADGESSPPQLIMGKDHTILFSTTGGHSNNYTVAIYAITMEGTENGVI